MREIYFFKGKSTKYRISGNFREDIVFALLRPLLIRKILNMQKFYSVSFPIRQF